MSALAAREPTLQARRLAPVAVAAGVSLAYLATSPPSADLAAVLLRARLGFTLWDNWWYAGHYTLSYSVLLAPLAGALQPRVAGALAATAAAALFEPLARCAFGPRAWLGAAWFAAGTAAQLYCGRLAFVVGLAFGAGAALALQRRRFATAAACAALAGLSSPVAAVFTALVAVSAAAPRTTGPRAAAAIAVAAAALVPVAALAVVFPGAGAEPFALSALAPIPPLAALVAWLAGAEHPKLRLGALLYAAACLAAYLIPTPLGGNVVRLGALSAGPLLALLLCPRRRRWLLLAAPALLYLQLQAPVRDVLASADSPTADAAYWRPLLSFLEHRPGRPFRVEVPFTAQHWEAYYLAAHVPLARGWERQLDTADDALFYRRGALTPESYGRWLRALAVRYVAVARTPLDHSAAAEAALIAHGLPYLRLVWRTPRFRVYEVLDATPLAQGAARATALGPATLTLRATRPGTALVRVRYSPYWALSGAAGCVSPAGSFTRVTLRQAGRVRLVIRFAAGRIGARAPRCTPAGEAPNARRTA
jgi:hypothetical protein